MGSILEIESSDDNEDDEAPEKRGNSPFICVIICVIVSLLLTFL